MRREPWAPPSSRSASSGWSRAARDCWPSACSVAARRLRRACAEGTAGAHTGRTLRASSGSGSARSFPGGRVAVAAGLPERAALDALLQGAAEAQRAPVLAAEPVADLVLRQLPLLAEEVLDQRDLAPQPPLVLVLVVLRDPRKRGVGRAAHRSPPVGRLLVVGGVSAGVSSPRAKRGACAVPRPSPRPSVYGSASSPGSAISSSVAERGGAMSSRSRRAASTPIVAWMMPPTIITAAPTR